MDSDKIIQLSIRLMELTSSEGIIWNLMYKSSADDDTGGRVIPSWCFSDPYTIVNQGDQFVYRSVVENKTFRLSGIVHRNGRCGNARLQLWNADETVLEYEFPDSFEFINLFQLVHSFAVTEADKFVDSFLKKSELLETAG